MAGVNAALDVVLGFLLHWPPILAIIFVSACVSVIMVFAYKFLTDQKEMKRLKDELAGHQKKMKEIKDDTEKLMEVQKLAMSANMQYMSKSMRPTLFTFLPIILVFGWMNAHFAFEPLMPQHEFTLTAFVNVPGNVSIVVPEGLQVVGDATMQTEPHEVSSLFGLIKHTDYEAVFRLKGEEGTRLVTLQSGGEEVDREVQITTERAYAPITQAYKGKVFTKADLGNQKFIVFWSIGWLGTYIIIAIALSSILRKLLKVY